MPSPHPHFWEKKKIKLQAIVPFARSHFRPINKHFNKTQLFCKLLYLMLSHSSTHEYNHDYGSNIIVRNQAAV